jgi:hypothetical protein
MDLLDLIEKAATNDKDCRVVGQIRDFMSENFEASMKNGRKRYGGNSYYMEEGKGTSLVTV